MTERHIDNQQLESATREAVENAERILKQYERHVTEERTKTPEAIRIENELKPTVSLDTAARVEASFQAAERQAPNARVQSEASTELRKTLTSYDELGNGFDQTQINTRLANELVRYKQGVHVFELAARSDLTPAGRSELLNEYAHIVDKWGGDKRWLVNNAEILEDLAEVDLNVFGPEQQRRFNDVVTYFDAASADGATGRNALNAGSLVSLATELQDPKEAAKLLNDYTHVVDRAKHVSGIEDVVNDIAGTNAAGEFRGSQFELRWIKDNANNPDRPIKAVALVEDRLHRQTKSMDVLLEDGRAVELKSYGTYSGQQQVENFRAQLELDVTARNATGAILVLDATGTHISPVMQQRLDRMIAELRDKYKGKSFEWEPYPRK